MLADKSVENEKIDIFYAVKPLLTKFKEILPDELLDELSFIRDIIFNVRLIWY
jgi:hypothetical protein